MDKEIQIKWAEKVILGVNKALPAGNIEFKDWQQCERLLAHPTTQQAKENYEHLLVVKNKDA